MLYATPNTDMHLCYDTTNYLPFAESEPSEPDGPALSELPQLRVNFVALIAFAPLPFWIEGCTLWIKRSSTPRRVT